MANEQPNPFAPHWLIRDIVIGSHGPAVGPGGLLFVGDSIVEGFYWNRLGLLPVLNAGYSGIWTEALEPKVPRLLELAKPRLAVLLVGTNDAKKGRAEADIDGVAAHLARILDHAADAAVPVIAVTPPPVEAGRRLTGFYDAQAMARLSRRIAEAAEGRAAALVDMHRAFSDEHGAAKPGVTTDGIHLSPAAYRGLHEMLERAVRLVTDRAGDAP